MSGLQISFDLVIPDFRMKFFEPFCQLGNFGGRQINDSVLNLFNVHVRSLAYHLQRHQLPDGGSSVTVHQIESVF